MLIQYRRNIKQTFKQKIMIRTKHFQYNGLDDYNDPLDEQLNKFFRELGLEKEDIIDIKYSASSREDSNSFNYSALVVYHGK